MGGDKALALFAGRPLIAIALGIFAGAGISGKIAGSRSQLGAYAEEIPDTWTEIGPLGGVHAALSNTEADWNVFLPVDLPLMPASFVALLLQRARLTKAPVTAAKLNGRLEPFPVVLHRGVLPLLQERLTRGQTSGYRAWQSMPVELGSTLDAVSAENLLQCGQCSHPLGLPPAFWFQSANTPEDLARLNSFCVSNGHAQNAAAANFSGNLKA
jgi:molybdopterin-guanine dinucleotide biosynthesis protein A